MNTGANRFRAFKSKEALMVHGAITDTTSFSVLNDLMSPNLKIDCSGLLSASWIGLCAFYQHLEDSGHTGLMLENVPYFIYCNMKLLPTFDEKVKVYSLDCTSFKPNDFKTYTITKLKADELRSKYPDPDVFIKDNDSFVLGSVRTLLPYGNAGVKPPKYTQGWSKANADECFFWQNYMHFVESTVGLSEIMLEALEVGLENLLLDILERTVHAEKALEVLNIPIMNDGDTVTQVTKDTVTFCEAVCKSVVDIRDELAVLNRELQALTMGSGDDITEVSYVVLKKFLAKVDTLHSIAAGVETLGTNTGDKILNLGGATFYRKTLLPIDGSKLSPEVIEKVRESFVIMDILSEGDWSATIDEISRELDGLDENINKCVILLQGFDLVRQVLEHRIKEAQYLSEAFKSQSEPWFMIKAELEKKIGKTMVTDQEKQACRFYLPETYYACQTTQTSAAAGDMMLF